MPRSLSALAVGAAAIVAVAVLAWNLLPVGSPSGVGAPAPTPTPIATATPAASPRQTPDASVDPSSWRPFTSTRYDYTISYPSTWAATPSSRLWTMERDHRDWLSPAADQFRGENDSILLTVFSAPMPAGSGTWIRSYFSPDPSRSPDPCTARQEASVGITADGYPAGFWAEPDVNKCGATYAFVPVGDRIYAFVLWRAGQEPLLKTFLSTVRFAGAGAGVSASPS